jgi:dCMP deaminase
MDKWDKRFLELAKFIAQWSKDPSTKTGAVIVDSKRRIVSVGYNGFARGVQDLPERLENRETKYKMVVHCEVNALLSATRSVEGCTLYTWPFMSCAPCSSLVIQAGIKRCVAPISTNERWIKDFELAQQMFSEAGVNLQLETLL